MKQSKYGFVITAKLLVFPLYFDYYCIQQYQAGIQMKNQKGINNLSSPSRSPHLYEEDSFEKEEEQSREIPRPIFGGENYELTFKKDMNDRYFALPNKGLAQRALFSNQQQLITSISFPLSEYYNIPIKDLENLPFADLISSDLEPLYRDKTALLGQILQTRRMRMKLKSSWLNLQCLQSQQSPSQQDKHKMYLLELLWRQLSKKLFIQTLKLHSQHRKFVYMYGENEQGSSYRHHLQQPESKSHYQIPEQGQFSQSNQSNFWRQSQISHDNMQEKLMIFVHSVSLLIQKALFVSFNRLLQAKNQSHVSPKQSLPLIDLNSQSKFNREMASKLQSNVDSKYEDRYESIPIISRPNIVSSDENINHQEEVSQNKLQELISYIEQLHEECAEAGNPLKKYFVRWKISLLQSIAQSLIHKMRENSMNRPQEENSEHYFDHQNRIEEEKQIEGSIFDSRMSRLTSQLSQNEGNTLKSQKFKLKQHIKKINMTRFMNRLRDHYELRKISSICVEMRRQNILHRCFRALKYNVQQQKLQRQMKGYYDQIADEQFEDDGLAKMFFRTNLIFKYFRKMKEFRRDHILQRVIVRSVVSIAFKRLLAYSKHEKKYGEMVWRHIQYMQNRLKFKCFSNWKQLYRTQNGINDRFKMHLKVKSKMIISHYFSMLKLEYKKSLLRQRKALILYQQRIKTKVFDAFKDLYQQNLDLKNKQRNLKVHLFYKKSNQFIHNFSSYYTNVLQYQRFSMKQQKLRRTLIKFHALSSIKAWRQHHMKKQAYQTIESKLVRLHKKQKKREILSIWLQRLLQIRYNNRTSNKSEKHKDWLVKYYGDLCSVLPT